MEALISVIIPVYNGEKFIDSIVDTINRQTYKNLEVIFVNDGSKDSTKEQLETLANRDPERYTVISQENQGVSAARNCGLAHATGEYIAFVDVDDLLHPRYFECLYQCLEGKSGCISVAGASKQECDIDFSKTKTHSLFGLDLLEKFLHGKVSTGVCGMLIPRQVMTTYRLAFKEGYKYSEDLHMVWRLFCHATEVVFVEAPLYIYRDIPGSAMTKINASRLDSLYLMQDLKAYFREHKPTFAQQFEKHGVARMAWSILWQAAHYLKYTDFLEYTKIYDFDPEIKKLLDFPDKRVTLSSKCYLLSKRIYHFAVCVITRNYRRQ